MNQVGTIQKHCQHQKHKTSDEEKQNAGEKQKATWTQPKINGIRENIF